MALVGPQQGIGGAGGESPRATRERWLNLRTSCAPVDRAAGEAAIEHAYRCAGRKAPTAIVWSDGPVDLQRQRLTARWPGANCRTAIVDAAFAKAMDAVRGAVPLARRIPIESAISFDAETRSTDLSVSEAVQQAVAAVLPNPVAWLRALTGRLRFRSQRQIGYFLADTMAPGERFSGLAVLDHYRASLGLIAETEAASGLIALAQAVGWCAPHADVCWAAERHQRFVTDATGRLHSADGPALAYADGTKCHFWKGLAVPAWIIERPDLITVQAINREGSAQLRRVLIDVMTPERYIQASGARRVAEDSSGVLWRTTWWNSDVWAAVEVENGTPEPDGRRRHYFLQVPPDLQTPTEAVAWTYGLSPRRYALLTQRT